MKYVLMMSNLFKFTTLKYIKNLNLKLNYEKMKLFHDFKS